MKRYSDAYYEGIIDVSPTPCGFHAEFSYSGLLRRWLTALADGWTGSPWLLDSVKSLGDKVLWIVHEESK